MNKITAITLIASTYFFTCSKANAQPILTGVKAPVFKKNAVNIFSLGPMRNGITLNSKSINDAISQLSKKGGGVVLIPSGLWLTGPIELKSHVNLHFQKMLCCNLRVI